MFYISQVKDILFPLKYFRQAKSQIWKEISSFPFLLNISSRYIFKAMVVIDLVMWQVLIKSVNHSTYIIPFNAPNSPLRRRVIPESLVDV